MTKKYLSIFPVIFLFLFISIAFPALGSPGKSSVTNATLALAADAGLDKVMCLGSTTMLGAPATGGTAPYSYSWTASTFPSGFVSSALIQSPVVGPTGTTTYTVTVTDALGATASDAVTVTVVNGSSMITNGDFETSTAPLLRGQIENASSWLKATGDADLFDRNYKLCQFDVNPVPPLNICGLNPADYMCIGIPCNHFGYQDVHIDGDKYAGLWAGIGRVQTKSSIAITANQDWRGMVEGIQTTIPALVSGVVYKLTFYASYAESGEVLELQRPIGAAFKVKLSSGGVTPDNKYEPVNATLLTTGSVTNTGGWQKIEYQFTPPSSATPFNNLIIESSAHELLQVFIDNQSAHINPDSLQTYFYIDDISLIPVCESQSLLIADAGPDKAICFGASVTLGGTPTAIAGIPPFKYTWTSSSSPTIPIAPDTPNPTITPSATETYTVTIEDAMGHIATDNVTITVSRYLNVDIGPATMALCYNNPHTIGNFATGGIPPYTYSWSPATWLSATNIAQPTTTPTGPITYTVTVTDAAGCTATDNVSITVNPSPTANAGSDRTICANTSTVLTGTASGGNISGCSGSSCYSYSWYAVETGKNYYGNNLTVAPSIPTHYILTVTDQLGCTGSDEVFVNTTGLKALAGADLEKCASSSTPATLTGSASGGTAPYTYKWLQGTTVISTTSTVSVNPTISTTYYLEVTDATGCKAKDDLYYIVNELPVADAGGPRYICPGGSVVLGSDPTASDGHPTYYYSWSPGGMTVANPVVTPASTTTYTVTVTDAKGCLATSSATVTVLPSCSGGVNPCPVTANAGTSKIVCYGEQATLTGTATGAGPFTYAWAPASIFVNPNVANAQIKAGVYYTTQICTLTVTNSCGYMATDLVKVTMTQKAADAGADRTICKREYTTLGTDLVAPGAYLPVTYTWTSSTGESLAGTRQIVVNPNTTTTYTQHATDGNGCIYTDDVIVTTIGPNVDAGPDRGICGGNGPVSIGTNVTGGSGNYTIRWEPTYGLSSTTSAITNANPGTTTIYTLIVKDNVNGCDIRDNVTVYVSEAVSVNAGLDKSVCIGSSESIGGTAVNGVGPYTYSWSPTNGLSSSTNPIVDASPTTTTTYTLTATDQFGCQATDQVKVTVNLIPQANAGPDKAICFGDCISIGQLATGGTGTIYYEWYPTTGLNDSHSATPNACPTEKTEYTVRATGDGGCFTEDKVTVQVFHSPEYVLNGTFEDVPTTPILRGQIDYSTGWYKATGDADLFDANFTGCHILPSPLPYLADICGLNPLDINCIGMPCNHFGYQDHISLPNVPGGSKYAGLWSAVGLTSYVGVDANSLDLNLMVEGIGYKIDMPAGLKPGKKYTLSFWVNKADKGEVDGQLPQVNNLLNDPTAYFKVKFSETNASNTLFRPVDAPLYYSGSVSDQANWVKHSFTFTAPAAYKYVIIESAAPDNIDAAVAASTGSLPPVVKENGGLHWDALQSYFYIDDISLQEACSGTPELLPHAGDDTTICKGNCVTLGGDPAAEYGNPSSYSYSWSSVPVGMTSTSAHPVVCPMVTTTYTLTVTDGSGTVATDEVVINVFNQEPYIDNGTFETVSPAPLLRGQLDYATGWIKATGDGDLFDLNYVNQVPCGLSPADYNNIGIPCNHFGKQGIHIDGEHHIGLWSAMSLENRTYTGETKTVVTVETPGGESGANLGEIIKRGASGGGGTITTTTYVPGEDTTIQSNLLVEGAEIKLNYTLDVNRTYKLVFYASKAEKGETGNNVNTPDISSSIDGDHLLVDSCAGINLKLSSSLATNILYQPIKRAIKKSFMVCDTTDWVKMTYVFKPDSAYRYIILESFPTNGLRTANGITFAPNVNPDPNNIKVDVVDGKTHIAGIQSYVYIDDVSLTEVCDTDKAMPQAYAGANVTMCNGNCATLGGSPSAWNGTAPYTYSWSPATGLNNPTIANPQACPTSTTLYTLTVTDASGNTATAGVNVEIITTLGEKVENGGFEDATQPDNRGQIENATAWLKGTGDPDLFDKQASCPVPCGTPVADYTCVGIPCNHLGDEDHYDPNGRKYAGLWALTTEINSIRTHSRTNVGQVPVNIAPLPLPAAVVTLLTNLGITMSDPFSNGWFSFDIYENIQPNNTIPPDSTRDTIVNKVPRKLVEAIETPFLTKLEAGHSYRMTFKISHAERGETNGILNSDYSKLNLKLHAGTSPIHSTIPFAPIDLPVLASVYTTTTAGWDIVTFNLNPSQDYNYLILESDLDPIDVAAAFVNVAANTNVPTPADILHNPASVLTIQHAENIYIYSDEVEAAASVFVPDANHIIANPVGTVNHLSNPNYVVNQKQNVKIESYFYIDDISVQERCPGAPRMVRTNQNNSTIDATTTDTENKKPRKIGGNEVAVYPNPNTGNFTLSINKENKLDENLLDISIFNSMGQLVHQLKPGQLKEGLNTFDISLTDAFTTNSSNGIYFVRINNGKECIVEQVTVLKF